MKVTRIVKNILSNYSDNPGVKGKICNILMHGKLGGTGKMLILPVDQGLEHGPARSFAPNPDAYDPLYHYELAIEAGLNAYAAPLGMLEAGADKFAGAIPTILKMNSGNSLMPSSDQPDQAITSSVKDALRLGCSAVGFTIYPGSSNAVEMMEEVKELSREAKENGLAVVIWSYPRGAGVSKEGETALNVISYAAHMAALMGAHIIKVKPPTNFIVDDASAKLYDAHNIKSDDLSTRIKHIMECSFAGRRLVVFSGGAGKSVDDLITEVRAIHAGGGNGSIVGRNSFQRPKADALKLLNEIINVYKSK